MSITSGSLSRSFVVVQDKKPASPFEGQIWVDTSGGNTTYQYKNGNFEKVQQDITPIKSRILELINDIAENRTANNLNPETYDNLFFDTFVDDSKIDTNNNVTVTTGTNGNLVLAPSEGTSFDCGSQSNKSTDSDEVGVEFNPNKEIRGIKAKIRSNQSNFSKAYLRDSNKNVIQSKDISGKSTGDFVEFVTTLSSGSTYYVTMDNDGSSWTHTRGKDLELEPESTTDVDGVGGYGSGFNPGYCDAYREVIALIEYVTSGTITSTNKTVDSTPTTVQIYQDAELNGQDITYTLKDGEGNTETITQTEIGETVSVSFTGTNMSVDVNFSGNGSKSPRLNEYGLDF